jgi:hypothetical protein
LAIPLAWQQLHFFTPPSLSLSRKIRCRTYSRFCASVQLGWQPENAVCCHQHARDQPCSDCASLGAAAIQGCRRSISTVSAIIMPRTSDAQSSRPTVILAQSDAPSIRQRDSITTSTMAPRTAFSRNVERPVELSHNDVPLYLDRCTPQSART